MPISKEIYWVETPLKNQHCGRCKYCKWDSCGQSWWCLCDESDLYEVWFNEDEGDFYKDCEYYEMAKQREDATLVLPKEEIYTYQKHKEPHARFYSTKSIRDDLFFCRHEKVAVYDIPRNDWFKYSSWALWHYLQGDSHDLYAEECKENEIYVEYGKYRTKRLKWHP